MKKWGTFWKTKEKYWKTWKKWEKMKEHNEEGIPMKNEGKRNGKRGKNEEHDENQGKVMESDEKVRKIIKN